MQSAPGTFRMPRALGGILLLLTPWVCGFALAENGASPEDTLARLEEAAMRSAVAKVADSVVQIRTIGGLDTVDRTLMADGPTTGLVLSPDGHIVSSAFNFVQQPASILVTFASGQQAPADLVATDHSRMIVLLKAHGVQDLPVPETAPRDEIRVGQWAVAVGRTFRPDQTNVTVGIVSAVGRMFGKAIQTDADVSTANYGGPLVDIRGRVIGVIVPMAPQTTSEVAGVEWYDSGIGFAVPLSAVLDRLEQLKQGADQWPGLLGISFGSAKPHDSPAELAIVLPNGPAGKAGLKKGDRIVEIDGQSIRTPTDLRFALGPRYGGDRVRVVVERGKERLEQEITLAGKLEPFRHAFLGVLPMRPAAEPDEDDDTEPDEADRQSESDRPEGVVVRMVYHGSGAAEAGIRPGDRIVRINDADVNSIDGAIEEMNAAGPGSNVKVQMVRGGRSRDLTISAGRLPTNVPSELPPAYNSEEDKPPPAEKAATEASDLKLPEFPQSCRVYVPRSQESGRASGVLLWLHAPGESQPDDTIKKWKPICDRDGLILVVPTAADPSRWERTESEYLRRLLERVMSQYRVDPRRVVVYGRGGGGQLAFLLALSSRDLVRGVATFDASLPRTARVPNNDPASRLAVLMELGPDGNMAPNVRQSVQQLTSAGYPVTALSTGGQRREPSADEREQLARWIDSLDRF